MQSKKNIAVIGAGSWGTALAIHLAHQDQHVLLWGNEKDHLEEMHRDKTNQRFLPDIPFPKTLSIEFNLEKLMHECDDVLIVVPSHAFRAVITNLKPLITDKTRFVWATKGLDPKKHVLLHEVIFEILGERDIAILSGPSFAKEVATELPTAVTIASNSATFSKDLIARFHSRRFRVYSSHDIAGVELGGAMKNVLAIAVGIADGLGFGANARSALITRGLAEMMRLGMELGGMRETFVGLAGLGDLVLTCTDNQSRNRRFGLALGAGQSREVAEKSIGQVVEGIITSVGIHHLAKRYNVEVPICDQVYRVLQEDLSPLQAVDNLLMREQRKEI